ncbi:MAG: hypothetical protein U1A27_01700 [Phycisphaerae bacterium]
MTGTQRRILTELLSLPTAPFCEQAARHYLRRFVARRPALRLREDRFGNTRLTYRGRRGRTALRPVLLAAHLDHPGFVATGMDGPRRVRADFRGWVDRDYFLGQRVRFFTEAGAVVGTIDSVDGRRTRRARRMNSDPRVQSLRNEQPPERVTLRVARPVPRGAIGMWDFPGVRFRGSRIEARACDDVAGAAAILCALDELCRTRAAGECHALFTRAEEVGFVGALAAVTDGGLPRRALIVAVECSRAIHGATLGAGPILRVGDKATVFSPGLTAHCRAVAEELAARDRRFAFQRRLMDGGTCESSVYCHFGYDATGLCLALENYHNMDRARRRIAPEIIDARDFENLVRWFVALVSSRRAYRGDHPGLDRRLGLLLRQHRVRLEATAALSATSAKPIARRAAGQ